MKGESMKSKINRPLRKKAVLIAIIGFILILLYEVLITFQIIPKSDLLNTIFWGLAGIYFIYIRYDLYGKKIERIEYIFYFIFMVLVFLFAKFIFKLVYLYGS